MLKKIAVAALTLASFGAVIPATAAAAERPMMENRVIVTKRVVHRRRIERRRPARKVVIVKRG